MPIDQPLDKLEAGGQSVSECTFKYDVTIGSHVGAPRHRTLLLLFTGRRRITHVNVSNSHSRHLAK